MFPEAVNELSTTTKMNVGWSPCVTSAVTTFDGGKTMAGFGKVTGTVYKSWVMRMWGTRGTHTCGTAGQVVSITGYVQMTPTVSRTHTGSTACTATANADVQWAFTD